MLKVQSPFRALLLSTVLSFLAAGREHDFGTRAAAVSGSLQPKLAKLKCRWAFTWVSVEVQAGVGQALRASSLGKPGTAVRTSMKPQQLV